MHAKENQLDLKINSTKSNALSHIAGENPLDFVKSWRLVYLM